MLLKDKFAVISGAATENGIGYVVCHGGNNRREWRDVHPGVNHNPGRNAFCRSGR
jgi:hypothetical protein